MKINVSGVTVNLCSAPAFMGHEEIVLPMLVLGSSEWGKNDAIGTFWHCINGQFMPNDLSSTAIVGYTSGMDPAGVNLETFYVGGPWDEWTRISEIAVAVDGLGRRITFFSENSAAPLQDGFISRCRLIARNRLQDFHPKAEVEKETTQDTMAREVIEAFLRTSCSELDFEKIYGDYFHSQELWGLYGDDEQFSCGYALWLEQEGVVRVWTRITYVPK